MSTQDEFQTWALNEGYIDFRQEAGRYVNDATRYMWIGWQASRAELVVRLPREIDPYGIDPLRDEPMLNAAAVQAAIESAGITVKP